MVRTLLRSIAVAGLLAAPVFAHDGCRFPFPRFMPPMPSFRIAMPRLELEFGVRHRVHRHDWAWRSERVWVEPVFELRVVGRDHCRRPIVRRVLVREGCWSARTYRACSCGESFRG